MSYGFNDDKVTLPTPAKRQPESGNIEEALKAGKDLGFVDRSTNTKRKPGRRQTEPQDKITLTGPKRILEQFQALCDREDATYWQGLEILLKAHDSKQ